MVPHVFLFMLSDIPTALPVRSVPIASVFSSPMTPISLLPAFYAHAIFLAPVSDRLFSLKSIAKNQASSKTEPEAADTLLRRPLIINLR